MRVRIPPQLSSSERSEGSNPSARIGEKKDRQRGPIGRGAVFRTQKYVGSTPTVAIEIELELECLLVSSCF